MSPSSVSSRAPKRSTGSSGAPAKRAAAPSAQGHERTRSAPIPPVYIQRYGLFVALLMVVIGFLLVVGSARVLNNAASAARANADDAGARQFLHATAYLTNTQNILILGSDKRTDEAMWRTDVIMLAAIDRASGRAAVISLPRDLYVDIPNYGPGRINTADFIGSTEGRSPQAGVQTLRDIIERDLGIETDNYVRIDFDGFKQIIDALGGVDVEVDCPLQDPYLLEAIGVERIEPGQHHMDGDFALAYVRSRRQGGDFDRARRQQRLLMAVRNRALSTNLITRLPQLLPATLRTVETDMNPLEMASLARWMVNMDLSKLKGFVIDANMTSFETLPSGEQVLKPDWASIHQGIANLFSPQTKPLFESSDRSWYCPGIEEMTPTQ
ncbi:LCP family protein [Candidatus Amarolinea aalborgensis]|uniref:LCP family protein n=1 Tax=Candidatus Amarolinea aalborgensis TaxID=2249329 RepID=UPI003BF9D382